MATPFVGRDEERTLVDEALDAAAASKGAALLLSGEPGIGKSRLVEEATLSAKAKGFAVVVGQAWEAEGTPAYWPWLEALRALGEDARLAAVIEEARSQSPELSALLGRSAASAVDATARFRLFDAVCQLLQELATARPFVLVLEDIHAADSATIELALFVMRSVKRVPLLLLCTSRDASFARSPEIAALLEKAAREATLIPLRRLTRAEVTEWVGTAMPARDAERIYEASEGNPLFVKELLASRSAASDVPLGIRGAIRAHLALLPERARELLEIASVLGREARVDVLYKLAGNMEALDDAVASSIVSRSADHVRFAHVLLRDEIYARMATSKRVEVHARAATVLKDEPAVAAHHVLQGRLSDSGLACGIIEAAMAEAVSRFATADAAALGESALASLALAPREQARLRVAVGEALLLGGSTERGKDCCRKAADIASSIGDPDLVARAALTYATELRLGRHEDTVAILQRALAALPEGDSPLRAQILARLGPAMIPATPEEGDAPRRFCRDAIAMARRVGDDATLFTTLRATTTTFPEDFELRERFALNAESIALAKRLGRVPHIVPMLPWQVACWLELGHMNGALEEAAAAESLLASLPQPHHQWRMLLVRANLAALDGRFAESDALGRKVLRMAREHDLREALVHFCIHRMSLPYLRGDPQGFEEFDPLFTTTLGHMHMASIFVSLGDAVMGRVDRARKGIDLARSLDLRAMPGAAQLGWTVIWANLMEHAEFFYELARKVADQSPLIFGPGALSTFGTNDVIAGQLAAMIGRRADALSHYERGLAFAKRLGAPTLVVQLERAIQKQTAGAATKPIEVPSAAFTIERRGEMWAIAAGSRAILVKDAKGFAYLDTLVQAPHREVHVLELVGAEDDGDAGPMLDERAKREYRRRADELRAELEEATRHNDLGRAERAREELDALAGELSRAVGVGGKDRRAASMSERARINVQRRLKDAIRRVVEQDEQLGRHLELSVKTGAFCMYAPTWP